MTLAPGTCPGKVLEEGYAPPPGVSLRYKNLAILICQNKKQCDERQATSELVLVPLVNSAHHPQEVSFQEGEGGHPRSWRRLHDAVGYPCSSGLIAGQIPSPRRAPFLPLHRMGTHTILPLRRGYETKAR